MTVKELEGRLSMKKFQKAYNVAMEFYLQKDGNVTRSELENEMKDKLAEKNYSETYINEVLDIFEKQ